MFYGERIDDFKRISIIENCISSDTQILSEAGVGKKVKEQFLKIVKILKELFHKIFKIKKEKIKEEINNADELIKQYKSLKNKQTQITIQVESIPNLDFTKDAKIPDFITIDDIIKDFTGKNANIFKNIYTTGRGPHFMEDGEIELYNSLKNNSSEIREKIANTLGFTKEGEMQDRLKESLNTKVNGKYTISANKVIDNVSNCKSNINTIKKAQDVMNESIHQLEQYTKFFSDNNPSDGLVKNVYQILTFNAKNSLRLAGIQLEVYSKSLEFNKSLLKKLIAESS